MWLPLERCAIHIVDTQEIIEGQNPLSLSYSYDESSDALSIYLIPRDQFPKTPVESETNDDVFIFDLDSKDRILSIEVLFASKFLGFLKHQGHPG